MTTTVDPNLTEQQSFLSSSEFARLTRTSLTLVQRGVEDGTIKSVRLSKTSRAWIPKSEAERYMGMKKAAPRGIAVSKKNAEQSEPKTADSQDKTSLPKLEEVNKAIEGLSALVGVTEAMKRLCEHLKEKLVVLGGN